MAITSAPFALKNLGLDAEPLRQALASLLPNTGGIIQAGDFTVTQTTTPSLGVSVGVGRAWMPGTNTSNLAGQSYSTQGQYFAINDGPVTVNLTTADPTNGRIDLIYIGAVDTFYGGATDVIKLDKVTGTPSGTPVVPTTPPNSIALAQVSVAANATTVLNANITTSATPFARSQSQPFKIAAGTTVIALASSDTFKTATITPPSGFTVSPLVTATIASNVGSPASKLQVASYPGTGTQFIIKLYTSDYTAIGVGYNITVTWQAIQMTPTSAAG